MRLTTQILLAPWRLNAALLAKQVASVHHLSNGRVVFGVGLGSREDDYAASGTTTARRGNRLTDILDEMLRIWDGEERGTAGGIGPPLDELGRPRCSRAARSRRRTAAPPDSPTAGPRAPGRRTRSAARPNGCVPPGARRAARASRG